MRPFIVKTIALKELLESLRDRRTLFLMIAVPILLYPALMLLITQVALLQQADLESEKTHVDLVGFPIEHPLIQALEDDPMLTVENHPWGTELASGEKRHVVLIAQAQAQDDGGALITLRGDPDDHDTLDIEAHFYSVEEASHFGKARVQGHIDAWNQAEVDRRLEALELPTSLARPTALEWVDDADSGQRGGKILAMVLPLLVIMTVLLGAFYPAIDLTAGEKERGSIQTLFTAPIEVLEIVAGKYLAVVGIAMISGMANLVSLTLIFGVFGAGSIEGIEVDLSLSTLGVLLVAIVLIALFFAALVLALAILARNFKDAQNILSPVMIVFTIPAMLSQLPGVELNQVFALMPAMNVILLMKNALLGKLAVDLTFLVVASSLAYTSLTLVFATKLFGQERVILGERGSFDIFARPSQIKAKARPSVAEGLAWVSSVFVLSFYGGYLIGEFFSGPLSSLVMMQFGTLLLPTLLLSRYLKLDWRISFSLRLPHWRHLVATLLMGASAWLLVAWLDQQLIQPLLPTPPELVEMLQAALPQPENLLGWVSLLAVGALTPAICEEALFRGFFFASLRKRLPTWALLVVTALVFALFHMSVYRLFGTFALGLVMAWLVWRSRSILTSMLFHFMNNGIALLASYLWIAEMDRVPHHWAALALLPFGLGLVLLGRGRS